jgi:flagellar assembly factor FliW
MKKIMTRFGEIEYDPGKTIFFPEGLIGFENLHNFVVIPGPEGRVLFWVQSVEDPLVAFVLTDPTNFFLDYRVVPDENESTKLGIDSAEDCLNLSVVTVHPDKSVTVNLQAPILYAPKNCRGLQVILEKSAYEIRTPLPRVPPAAESAVTSGTAKK